MRDTLYCVICVLTSCLLAVLASRYITHIWILAFFESLQMHFGIACSLAAALALLIRRHWYAMLMLVAALGITSHSIVMLQTHATDATRQAAAPSYRLLSFNIDGDNYDNAEKIGDLIAHSNADVVEIFEAQPVLTQMGRLLATYPYRIGCGVIIEECDSLMLSKRPFLSQSVQSLSGLWRNRFIMATIDLDGHPVAFASAHLTKPYFDDFHDDELHALSDILKVVKAPLLLAGDFNASVLEPDMQAFLGREGLKHVFPEPATWPIAASAYGIAIDHVFARQPLQLKSVRQVEDAMGSNHYGLMTEFTVTP